MAYPYCRVSAPGKNLCTTRNRHRHLRTPSSALAIRHRKMSNIPSIWTSSTVLTSTAKLTSPTIVTRHMVGLGSAPAMSHSIHLFQQNALKKNSTECGIRKYSCHCSLENQVCSRLPHLAHGLKIPPRQVRKKHISPPSRLCFSQIVYNTTMEFPTTNTSRWPTLKFVGLWGLNRAADVLMSNYVTDAPIEIQYVQYNSQILANVLVLTFL